MTTEPNSLRDMLQEAYPARLPSDDLRARVEALADDAPRMEAVRRGRMRQAKLRFAGACATVLLIGALLLLPRLNAVLALNRMADSLRDVRSVHSVQWQILPGGKRVKSQEQWYQGGNWHVEDAEIHRVQICSGGKRWNYSGAENTVTLEREPAPIGYQGMTGFSVTAGVRDGLANGLLTDVKMLGAATVHGHAVHWMQITDNKYPDARSKVAVEDATGLPLENVAEVRAQGVWTQVSVGEAEYNLPLAKSLFVPSFPKTARLIDVEAGREIWRQRLAKGIASQERGTGGFTNELVEANGTTQIQMVPIHGPRRVVVRDFETNANGDVFLLYTDGTGIGSGDHLRSAELTDEYGTQYVRPGANNEGLGHGQFIAACLEADPQRPRHETVNGYLFNNEQLIGQWWVPVKPSALVKPHHFTLTLHEELDYGRTTFHLDVDKPACAVIPEYMPYMARQLTEGWEVSHEEAMTRGEYYAAEGHDPAQALTWYQKAIAVDQDADRMIGGHYTEEFEWFAIYQIQSQLGHTEEAKTALLNANRDAVYAGPMRDKIRAEMDKLGLTP